MAELSFGEKLIRSAQQAEAHSAGQKKLQTKTIEILPVPQYQPREIRDIRTRLGLTQGLLGGVVGVSSKTVEAWEAGNRRPSSAAMRVIAELDNNPLYLEKIVKTR